MTKEEALPKRPLYKYTKNNEFHLLHWVQLLNQETFYYLVRGRIPAGARRHIELISDKTTELYMTIRLSTYELYEFKFRTDEMEEKPTRAEEEKMKRVCRDKAYKVAYPAKRLLDEVRIRWEMILGIQKGLDGEDFVIRLSGFSEKRKSVFEKLSTCSRLLNGYLAWLR